MRALWIPILLAASAAPVRAGELAPFPHRKHVEAGAACQDCHDLARPGLPVAVAGDPGCLHCHEDEAPPRKLLGPLSRPPARRLAVRFPHARHTAKVECLACHRDVADDRPRLAGQSLVARDACFTCHAARKARVPTAACARCHGVDERRVAPGSHDAGWPVRHGGQARLRQPGHGRDCRLCHGANPCTTCHDQRAPGDHTGLWRMRSHGMAAELGRERCRTCHEPGVCVRCHATTTPVSHNAVWTSYHGLVAGARGNSTCNVCHSTSWCARMCHLPR